MFIAIETHQGSENFLQMSKKRNETAIKLWEISCCEVNVFNKTKFDEL